MKNKLSNILTALFLSFFAYYIIVNPQIIEPLLRVSLLLAAFLILLKATAIIVSGLTTKYTLEAFKKSISIKETTFIAFITSMGNYFGPLLGGAGIRAVYLKKKYDFAYTHFTGTFYGYYLITFFTNALIGIVALIMIYYSTNEFSRLLNLFYLGVLLLTGSLFFIRIPKLNAINVRGKLLRKIIKRLNQISEGWDILLRNKNLITKLVFVSFATLLLSFLISWVEFRALNIDASIYSIILYSSLGSMSMLVSLTPAAIGIRESIYLFASDLIGINLDQILQLAAIDRGAKILVLFIGYLLMQKLTGSYTAKTD